jgi:hypothetical protein
VIHHHKRRKFHAKEASQLHPGREGIYPQASLRNDGGARKAKKRTWGALTGGCVPHDVRDAVVDFVQRWSEKANIALKCFIRWLAVAKSKFYS